MNRILQFFPDVEARTFHRLKRRQRRIEAALELIEPQTVGLVEFIIPSIDRMADGETGVVWFVTTEPESIPLDVDNASQHVATEMMRLATEFEYAAKAVEALCSEGGAA
ncbi:MAG: hypothetical protein IID45_08640 [Planctomycetes bacterium]|nr:hypothetical protein [Planctomycetota bacterium]